MSFGVRVDIVAKDKISKDNYKILKKIILDFTDGEQTYDNWCEFYTVDNKVKLESHNGVCFDNKSVETLLLHFSNGENNVALIRIWVDYHTANISDATDFLCKDGNIVGKRKVTFSNSEELGESVIGIPSFDFTLENLDESTFK